MTESIKKAEEAFMQWMASTRTGSIFKVAFGAVLVWLLDSVSSWDIPAWAMIALVAVIPMVINEINPKDHRYGIGASKG
jgi:hypothetical protein